MKICVCLHLQTFFNAKKGPWPLYTEDQEPACSNETIVLLFLLHQAHHLWNGQRNSWDISNQEQCNGVCNQQPNNGFCDLFNGNLRNTAANEQVYAQRRGRHTDGQVYYHDDTKVDWIYAKLRYDW